MYRLYKPALFTSGLFLIVFLLTACKHKIDASDKPKANPPVIVDAMIASTKPLSNIIEATGSVVANEYVELHPEASGRLTYLNIPDGKFVQQGTVLAIVNNADLKAQIDKSKVQLDLAEKTEERYKQLLAVSGINQSDYDAALNTVNGYKADVQYNQALYDKTILRAPFSGVIGLREVSLGAYVSSTTLIATLQQLDKVKIDFTIPEEYGTTITPGAIVEVETDATKQTRSKAIVEAVEPQINQDSRNVTVRAILQNVKVSPGGFVKVYINAGVDQHSIMVPSNSLIPDDKNNQIVLVKGGNAKFVNVTTGVRKANNVEILDGVHVGDTIVVTGVLFARPKAPLKVRSIKTLDQFATLNNNVSPE
jgi:membrane fusion protein (multidrug efflux system)